MPLTLSRPRAPFASIALCLALALVGFAPTAQAQQQPGMAPGVAPTGVTVDSITVRGNQRRGRRGDPRDLRAAYRPAESPRPTCRTAIRRLMATGNFDDVQIFSDESPAGGARLIIEVTERPLITRTEFRGLERISARTVRDTVGIQDNQPLNPNQVLRTEQMIRNLLAREGVQVLSVDTTLTAVPDQPNSYRLTFNVREGNRLAIADIDFQGNDAFSDEALRGAMSTRPEGFLWFRTGRFDRERFQEDLQERLPNFYGQRGYIDFAVVSDTLVVDPGTGKAQLVITVDEGAQYRLGEFAIEGATRFPQEQLERMFTVQRRSRCSACRSAVPPSASRVRCSTESRWTTPRARSSRCTTTRATCTPRCCRGWSGCRRRCRGRRRR